MCAKESFRTFASLSPFTSVSSHSLRVHVNGGPSRTCSGGGETKGKDPREADPGAAEPDGGEEGASSLADEQAR